MLGRGEQPPVRHQGDVLGAADQLDIQGLSLVGAVGPPERLRAKEHEVALPGFGKPARIRFLRKGEKLGESALALEEGAEQDRGVREKPRGLVSRGQDHEALARGSVV